MDTSRRRRTDRQRTDLTPRVPNVLSGIPSPPEISATELTHDEIARRAYARYERRGGEHGHDWEDWLQAERELRQQAGQRTGLNLPNESAYALA